MPHCRWHIDSCQNTTECPNGIVHDNNTDIISGGRAFQDPGLRSLLEPQAILVSNVYVKPPRAGAPPTPPPSPSHRANVGSSSLTLTVRITLPQLLLYSPMKVRARQSRNMSATLTMLRWYLAKQVSSSRFPFPPSSRKPPSPSPLRWNASASVGLK